MDSLNDNWITEKHIDFEYKKYVLLGYLQKVSEHFDVNKLYPFLSDLLRHYKSAVMLRDSKQAIYNKFPENLSSADIENQQLIYEKLIGDDILMQEIENIISYSIPQFEKYINEGKKSYDFIESRCAITPVGIVPLNPQEGYLLLSEKTKREAMVFEYQITIFEEPDARYRGIHMQYVMSFEKSLTCTYEAIKTELIKSINKFPNPATYLVESSMEIPFEETFLPIAKRTLVRYLATSA